MGLINNFLFAGGFTKTNKDETKNVGSSVLKWMKKNIFQTVNPLTELKRLENDTWKITVCIFFYVLPGSSLELTYLNVASKTNRGFVIYCLTCALLHLRKIFWNYQLQNIDIGKIRKDLLETSIYTD